MTAKTKLTLQITCVYIFVLLMVWLSNNYKSNLHYEWIMSFICIFEIALICYITRKMDEEPLSSIGLQSVSIMDIGHGAVLGIILYLLYTIPLKLFMNMSVTQYPLPFDEMPFLYKLLFISLFTAITEEVIFRGYIFTKLNQLVRSKWVVILISCILFYAVHLPRILTFSGNQIYESFITTILFCYYLYFFTKKSIIPLMIAHCFYIILRAGYGYIVWNAIFSMF